MFRKVLLPLFATFVIATCVAGYVYGPPMSAMFLGKPYYLVKPSPRKYASDALTIMETMGIHGASDDFNEAKKQVKNQAKSADSYADTHEALRAAIKTAGGKHSNLISPEDNVPGTKENTEMPHVEKRGGVAVAKVPEVAQGPIAQEYADTLSAGIKEHARCGAVVDLRGNGGGDMGPMLAGLSPLLPDGTALEFVTPHNTSPVTINGNSVKGGGSPVTTSGGKLNVPVAVLVDGETASSGEATLLSFRGLDNSRSFGKPSAGYASANVMIDLPDGAGLMLTTAKDRDRTGAEYMDDPVVPDVTTDDALEAALAWLAEQGC
ncbi:S41 family peptidase [Corynebacterium epidermidicanis]|uniref:Peptidase family S41 n=1 Tax=Corynebacterium epidermidicanis TaxID=1050174 RepID=A0A0G3GSQ2_9CORY|nr:S41 family peptidase [Corynebacterium epidermidicanis]AKK04181.1 Peptidase family S41 [Corynebacterium epidermidicanis]